MLYILCKKLQDGLLTEAEHEKAVKTFSDYMRGDAFYFALTEELAKSVPAEFLTFDKRMVNVVASNSPSVLVNLLPS